MSSDPDEIDLAETRGWEQGKSEGRNNGLARAAKIVQDAAYSKFIQEHDTDAEYLRDLAKSIREEID